MYTCINIHRPRQSLSGQLRIYIHVFTCKGTCVHYIHVIVLVTFICGGRREEGVGDVSCQVATNYISVQLATPSPPPQSDTCFMSHSVPC